MSKLYSEDKMSRGVTPLEVRQMVPEKSRSSWKGAKRIREVLRTKDATWGELRREAVRSHTALSRFLQDLRRDGYVFKGLIDGKYSSYERADEVFLRQLDNSIVLSDEILFVKDFLERNTSSSDVESFKEKAIKASAMLLTAVLPALIYNTLRSDPIQGKTLGDLESVASTLTSDEMIDIFIRPWIHNLVDLCLLDKELAERIALEICSSMYGAAFKEYDEYLEILDKLL
jgi:hypothetical protein